MKPTQYLPDLRPEDLPAVLDAIRTAWPDPDLRYRIAGGLALAFSGSKIWPDPEMSRFTVEPGGAQ